MDLPDSPRLLARVRDKIRFKHYNIRTEQAYVDWIKRFIRFHGKRHPTTLGAPEAESFLTDLAVARNVAAPTRNQAKSAPVSLQGGARRRAALARRHPERAGAAALACGADAGRGAAGAHQPARNARALAAL